MITSKNAIKIILNNTLRKEKKMEIKELIVNISNLALDRIASLAKSKMLDNLEKKERLDDYITDYINVAMGKLKLNFVFKLILKKFLIPNVPVITQSIFDLVKVKLEGVTRK